MAQQTHAVEIGRRLQVRRQRRRTDREDTLLKELPGQQPRPFLLAVTQADVGFAIGAGTDVAIETAAITLMRHSLMGVADALAISKATLRNMKQNLLGAFIYNSIGIPVAAGILWPFTGTLLNPVVAGAAMALSSITVVSNANRLLRFKPKE